MGDHEFVIEDGDPWRYPDDYYIGERFLYSLPDAPWSLNEIREHRLRPFADLVGAILEDEALTIVRMPWFYREPRPALPWGDSAYTSFVPYRLLPGEPDHGGWFMGPPDTFTPSSEGPRRAAEANDRALRTLLDRWGDGRPARWTITLGDDEGGAWPHAAGYTLDTLRPDRRPYNYPMPTLRPGDRYGWIDDTGVLHTETVGEETGGALARLLEKLKAITATIGRMGL